jgi:hypothetical protein
VVDEHLFKSLTHTFHILAENEEANISKKKQTDEKFKKEYKKTGKKRDLKKMEKEDLPAEEEEKEPRVNTDFISNSVKHRRIKNMIPGFSIIKNRIITPLLIASERVVEYMIPEQKEKTSTDLPPEENIENTPELSKDDSFLNTQMSKLSLEELERHQRKRSVKCLTKSNHNVQISKNLMNKASDCVDYISERMPVESKVTRNFVTNMIELSDSALKRIATSCKGIDDSGDNINMRFIKPSKKFYNLLMSVWIKMDTSSIFNLTEEEFIENVKQALEKEDIKWSEAFLEPTKTFYNIAKEEFMNLYKSQKDDASDLEVEPQNFVFSVSRFFTSIKSNLLTMWNSEIVSKSAKFTAAQSAKETEESNEEAKEGPTEG